jgi:hypothetical protein
VDLKLADLETTSLKLFNRTHHWQDNCKLVCTIEYYSPYPSSNTSNTAQISGIELYMADQDSVRQRIIASVFSRRSANGAPEDIYMGHIKIWEDDGSGRKARYILLSGAYAKATNAR